MTFFKSLSTLAGLIFVLGLSACGKDKIIDSCSEPESYQAVAPGKRVVAPEGLDQLDEFREMPIPKATTPPRAEGAGCLERPPSVLGQ